MGDDLDIGLPKGICLERNPQCNQCRLLKYCTYGRTMPAASGQRENNKDIDEESIDYQEKSAQEDDTMAMETNESVKGDVTHLVQRIEAFEDRMGVRIEALFAYLDDEGGLKVNFELHSRNGNHLQKDTKMVVTVYDKDGRLISQSSDMSFVNSFFGFDTYSIYQKFPGKLAKIRLTPRHPLG